LSICAAINSLLLRGSAAHWFDEAAYLNSIILPEASRAALVGNRTNRFALTGNLCYDPTAVEEMKVETDHKNRIKQALLSSI
jgi:hypothetical protein